MNIKLALFTSQFPSKVSTFFARDLYSLISNGFEVDVFPVYPVSNQYWENVPECLREKIIEKSCIKFITPLHFSWKNLNSEVSQSIRTILKQSISIGPSQFLKSLSVIQQAILWANSLDGKYDYMLSYWGNYAGTYAFIANKLIKNKIPFSFFLHAGTDLYRDRIFLEQKISHAKKVFTVCEFNRDYLQKTYPKTFESFEKKIVIHHLGIDTNDITYNILERESNTLLSIGTFYPPKGFSSVIQAISLLGPECNIKLILIGDGPERRNLMRLVRVLGIEDRVEFTGWLPFDEVKKYLAKCTILVHPSCDLGDAVPTVIKEAMASGLPVIGANIAGIPELLDHGAAGILFPPKDYIALAEAIRKLLNEDELRMSLAKRGRSFAEQKFDMWRNGHLLSLQLSTDLFHHI